VPKRRDDFTPSLFDEPAPVEETVEAVVEDDNDWEEVPQARFLSWSTAMQLHYCWRRDLTSALDADNDHDATFFLERAAHYKEALDEENADHE